MTKGTITKTGNSYAIRVPKQYITDNDLQLGDIVTIEDPLEKQHKAMHALVEYGKKQAAMKGTESPVLWQRKQRSSWRDPWKSAPKDGGTSHNHAA